MKFLDSLLGKPTLKSVTEDVAKVLRARGETDLVVNTTEGSVDIRRNGESEVVVNVHNLLHELLGTPRAERTAKVRRFLSGTAPANGTPKKYEDVIALLRPVVRFEHEFSLHSLQAQVQMGREMDRMCRQTVVNDVVAALAIDMPDSMSLVTEEHLKEWGVTFEDAFDQATLNLRGHTEQEGWKAIRPGVWSGEWGDSYESSRILLPDVFHRLGISDPVAMVPFRDAILVTSARDELGLERMLDIVERAIETTNRWISFKPAILQEKAWLPFTPPPALQERFRRIAITNSSSTYSQQKELLDSKFKKESEDVFVATYSVLETDGKAMSWATWTKGVSHALLPITDLVILGAPEELDLPTLIVPWDRVRELVGHLMLTTEINPPRFRVREFPSSDEFSKLQAVASSVLAK